MIEKYRFLQVLSHHSDRTVWLAEHIRLGSKRIIKQISLASSNSSGEICIMKNLDHPAIPQILDVVEDAPYIYIVEQYIEGESLGELCSRRLLSFDEVFQLFFQIASIIDYLHSKPRQILYLDLKPSNILVSSDKVFLVDFGSALKAGSSVSAISGTEGFCSPEQINGGRLTFSSDIFSLGRLLLFMLENSEINGRYSSAIRRIVKRCCHITPLLRPGNVSIPIRMMERLCDVKKVPDKPNRTKETTDKVVIGVMGICPGAGTTHISLCLANILSSVSGRRVCFVEQNRHKDIERLFDLDAKGVSYNAVDYFPEIHPKLDLEDDEYAYEILDLGSNRAKLDILKLCNRRILVGPSAEWREDEYGFLKELSLGGTDLSDWILYVNLCDEEHIKSRDSYGMAVAAFPFVPDPFSAGKMTVPFMKRLV